MKQNNFLEFLPIFSPEDIHETQLDHVPVRVSLLFKSSIVLRFVVFKRQCLREHTAEATMKITRRVFAIVDNSYTHISHFTLQYLIFIHVNMLTFHIFISFGIYHMRLHFIRTFLVFLVFFSIFSRSFAFDGAEEMD